MTTEQEQKQFNDYAKFVISTTSDESLHTIALISRLHTLQEKTKIEFPQLLTASIGMQAESGEFSEVIKKIIFQGKEYNEDERFHLKRELGDIMWYMAQACMALDTTFDEILEMNYEKLSARFPEGAFDVYRSENRVVGDV